MQIRHVKNKKYSLKIAQSKKHKAKSTILVQSASLLSALCSQYLRASLVLGRFQSGQMGRTVNPLLRLQWFESTPAHHENSFHKKTPILVFFCNISLPPLPASQPCNRNSGYEDNKRNCIDIDAAYERIFESVLSEGLIFKCFTADTHETLIATHIVDEVNNKCYVRSKNLFTHERKEGNIWYYRYFCSSLFY